MNVGIHKDSYLNTDFCLTFPTVDTITDALKELGKGAHLYKTDISRAFCHVKVDPGDHDFLGLHWGAFDYADTCIPFESRHGIQIFQRLSNTVRFILRTHGFKVINYVDNFIGVGVPSVACRSFACLQDLLCQLGFDFRPS